jgi:hypothetical protein
MKMGFKMKISNLIGPLSGQNPAVQTNVFLSQNNLFTIIINILLTKHVWLDRGILASYFFVFMVQLGPYKHNKSTTTNIPLSGLNKLGQ